MDRVARVNLEMGGKDPFIVCADMADRLDVAARGGAWAAYLNAGQVCTSAERFYVQEEIYDDYVNAFVDVAKGLVVGDPMKGDTDLGPMVSAAQRAKVADQVEAAVGAGAELLAGGDTAGNERGHFFAPAVVTGRGRRDRAAQRGDLRPRRPAGPGQEPRRGDRARQLDALRARGQHLHPGLQDDPALHARGEGRDRLVQRPAHR